MTEKDNPHKKNPEKEKEKENKKQVEEEEKIILPPLDFSSLVLPFFTQALIELGQLEEKTTGKSDERLELVKRLIDLIDLLQSRTSGNLKSEEDIFLSQCLHQLRMAYMEKAKIISL